MARKDNQIQHYRINEKIFARELRVIGPEGQQIGILSKAEALEKARAEGLDLVEIAPTATPPVAKIVSFGKFKYQEEKKARIGNKGKSSGGDVKEIRFSPFIAENDYNTRLERVREFLTDKNKVRLSVVFKGTQLRSKNFGYELLKKLAQEVEDLARVEVEPRFMGRHLTMLVTPSIKKGQNAKNENEKANNKTS